MTNYKSLALAYRLVCLVPRMLFDLSCCEALIGVGLKYLIDEINAVGRESLWHLELAAQNLLVQLCSGFILEG